MTTHLNPPTSRHPRGPGKTRTVAAQPDRRPRGGAPGRSGNPLVEVAGLAWLEFEKPDLGQAERFGTDFGFTAADQTPEALLLRGRHAGPACLVIRRGQRPRFAGVAWHHRCRDADAS